jgi:uridylate kinase
MKNKNIVIKIGGSLFFKDGKINTTEITKFCSTILQNKSNFNHIIIICGGGALAREYINDIRTITSNESLCDIFGIEISRINSKLIIAHFGEDVYPQVPKSIEELSIALLFNKIIIMGGLQPGQSTTSVAVEVSEYINADNLILLTDVEGIYDKDPKKFSDAKLLKKLNYEQLQEIIVNSMGDKQAAAGEYRIFDIVSLQILKRSNIKVFITSGKNLKEFEKFCHNDKNVVGTLILKE